MSFFKDFKADFTQAMNELMPAGNEMYDDVKEDTQDTSTKIEEQKQDTNLIVEPIKKEKKTKKVEEQLSESEAVEEIDVTSVNEASTETTDEDVLSLLDELSANESVSQAKNDIVEEDIEVAPEDMLDQIDDLLNEELGATPESESTIISDETEVNTMDMDVASLLDELSKSSDDSDVQNQNADATQEILSEDIPVEEAPIEEVPVEEVPVEEDPVEDTTVQETSVEENDSTNLSDVLNNMNIDETNQSLEDLLNAISEENLDQDIIETPSESNISQEQIANDIADPINDSGSEDEQLDEVEVEFFEAEAVNTEDDTNMSLNDFLEANMDTEPEETVVDNVEKATESAVTNQSESEKEVINTVEESNDVNSSTIIAKEEVAEEIKMEQDKDVISISPVEEKKAEPVKETPYSIDEADAETTYITKGTVIRGNLDTDGSIDIIGEIEGDVTCKGKIVIGGSIKGAVTAGELYANSARIEGDIKSYGSVKIGVGSMIIGNVEGDSAVIAGAINGDIDVKGPVIVDSTAVIMGNIKSRSVQINNGAVIEGFCSQSYSDIDVKSFFS